MVDKKKPAIKDNKQKAKPKIVNNSKFVVTVKKKDIEKKKRQDKEKEEAQFKELEKERKLEEQRLELELKAKELEERERAFKQQQELEKKQRELEEKQRQIEEQQRILKQQEELKKQHELRLQQELLKQKLEFEKQEKLKKKREQQELVKKIRIRQTSYQEEINNSEEDSREEDSHEEDSHGDNGPTVIVRKIQDEDTGSDGFNDAPWGKPKIIKKNMAGTQQQFKNPTQHLQQPGQPQELLQQQQLRQQPQQQPQQLQQNKLIQKKPIMRPRKLQKRSLNDGSSDSSGGETNQNIQINHGNQNIQMFIKDIDPSANPEQDQTNEGQAVEIDAKELVKDCIAIITECDPNKSCSKDQLIARVTYQRRILLKQTNGEWTPKVAAMDKILRDLNEEWTQKHMSNMNTVRDKQDKLIHPMEKTAFKQKTDLSKERKPGDPLDPSLQIQIDSRKYWKLDKNKKTKKAPKELEMKFKKTRGNLKMPSDLKKKIY